MLKQAAIAAFVPLLLTGSPVAAADWSASIAGATAILPSRFMPLRNGAPLEPRPAPIAPPASAPLLEPARLETVSPAPPAVAPSHETTRHEPADEPSPAAPNPPPPDAAVWSLPLVDRTLSQAQKTADIEPGLLEAMARIVPLYDRTRLEGADAPEVMKVSAGTAVADSVFADRWRRADPDPNVDIKVRYLAMAWRMKAAPCEAFTKARAHGFGEPALTALSQEDCARLADRQALGFADTIPVPIVVAAISVPVFAAPLPGSRLSSKDFWAAQRARIAAIQAHLDRKWRPVGTSQIATAGNKAR